MKIISHRGLWSLQFEKNSMLAFKKSIAEGFGIETDVRDCKGDLVISHDPPSGDEIRFDDFLKIPNIKNYLLAINVKADGLSQSIKKSMTDNGIQDWFVFDMSIPDQRKYHDAECPVFCRISEVETTAPWLSEAQGIWLDSFNCEWFDEAYISDLLRKMKVCIVSSELHGRRHEKLWSILLQFKNEDNLILCTDLPRQARVYFEPDL